VFTRRSITVFAAAFSMVLVAGIAAAGVGPFAPDDPVDDTVATQVEETTATTEALPATEPEHEDGVDKPSDDGEVVAPVDKPEEEPADEPKDEEDGTHEEEPKEEEPVADVTPPEFAILHPADGQHFETKEVVFEGEVEPGAKVFAGDYEADVNEDGGWRIVLWLNPGQNVATLHAVDEAGNKSTDTVTVHFDQPEEPTEGEKPKEGEGGEEPPKEEPGGEEPAEVDFTANQTFGSCGEAVPYDVFYGTATPGTTIWVVSDFGSGTTTANDNGKWEIRVEFPEAPYNDQFDVVIENEGGRKVFGFTRTGDGGEH